MRQTAVYEAGDDSAVLTVTITHWYRARKPPEDD